MMGVAASAISTIRQGKSPSLVVVESDNSRKNEDKIANHSGAYRMTAHCNVHVLVGS